jgi:dolichol kinase
MSEKLISRPGILKQEIIRKFIHISSGIVISVLYTFSEKDLLIISLLFTLFIILFLEVLRFRGMVSVPFLRDREKKKVGGHAFFMLGAFISILLFDKQIAIASILMLAIGDAASGLAQAVKRRALGREEAYKRGIKPPDVILIMLSVSFLVGYYTIDLLTIAISGAIGATIADGVQLRIYGISIDDNLTIPLYSGFLMTLVSF